jgi:hypothetical protein
LKEVLWDAATVLAYQATPHRIYSVNVFAEPLFPNHMGRGSYANIAAAVTVAASSFSMQVTDTISLLQDIDIHI